MSHHDFRLINGILVPKPEEIKPGKTFWLDFYGIDVEGQGTNLEATLRVLEIKELALIIPGYFPTTRELKLQTDRYRMPEGIYVIDINTQGIFADQESLHYNSAYLVPLIDILLNNPRHLWEETPIQLVA